MVVGLWLRNQRNETVDSGKTHQMLEYSRYLLVIKHGRRENPLSMEVLIGKSHIDGPFSIALFDYWRVVAISLSRSLTVSNLSALRSLQTARPGLGMVDMPSIQVILGRSEDKQ